ncbi:hypothetical protein [Pseudoxanthomonas sp. USHLN014]|uniref:hypothetical protein n=1 Tax=Pseudoxanthomonas sp. USHLN014 TaxID=3081297 RepID=UPI00301C4571
MSANFDGREVLLPTVSEDGRILSNEEAIDLYRRTGRNLGVFDTPEHATAYAKELHNAQAAQYVPAEDTPKPWERYARPGGDSATEPVPNPTDSMTTSERVRAGAGKAFNDTFNGIRQLGAMGATSGASSLSDSLRSIGLDGLADTVGQSVLVPAVQYGQRVQSDIDEAKRLDAPLMRTGAGLTGNMAGNVALTLLPAGEAGVAARSLGTAGRIGASAATGGALSAMQPVATGDSRGQNALIGAALGGAGQAVGSALGAMGQRALASVDPIRQRAIQVAQEQGIPLHLSQISESAPVKAMASMAQYLPFSGAGKAAQSQQAAFNRAAGRTFGAEADQLGDEVMRGARQRLSQRFEDIYGRNDIPLGPEAITKLADVVNTTGRRLTKDEASVVANQFDDILQELNQSGVLTGQKYQALRTQIMKAEGPDKVGQAVGELRRQLDDIAAEAVGPNDSAALKQLRSQWANFRTVEKALRQVAGAGGDVKPSALWPLVRNGSTAEMRDLARLGQTVMKNPVPDSGTAGRLVATNLLGLGGATAGGLPGLAGLLLGGATVGRALNSNALARLAATTSPVPALNALARLAAPAAAGAAPVAAAASQREKVP